MKIRNGFVSNSSSSSFIVAFDKKPESAVEVQELMFGGQTHFGNPYDHKNIYTTQQIAQTVYNDITKKSLTPKEVISEVNSGYHDKHPDYNKFKDENGDTDWDAYEKTCYDGGKEIADNFLEKQKEKFINKFEYSDNDGEYFITLEHGGIFDKLPHIRVSKH